MAGAGDRLVGGVEPHDAAEPQRAHAGRRRVSESWQAARAQGKRHGPGLPLGQSSALAAPTPSQETGWVEAQSLNPGVSFSLRLQQLRAGILRRCSHCGNCSTRATSRPRPFGFLEHVQTPLLASG